MPLQKRLPLKPCVCTPKPGQGCVTGAAPGTAAGLTVQEGLQQPLPLPAWAATAVMLEAIPADLANSFHETTLVNLAKGAGEACAGSEADQTAAIDDLYSLQSTVRSLV